MSVEGDASTHANDAQRQDVEAAVGNVVAPAVTRPVLASIPSDDSGDVPDLVSTDQSMPPTSGTKAHSVHRQGEEPSLGQRVSGTGEEETQVDPSLGVARLLEVLPGEVGAASDEKGYQSYAQRGRALKRLTCKQQEKPSRWRLRA